MDRDRNDRESDGHAALGFPLAVINGFSNRATFREN
jgi:hypothetical protein